jgi:hypothetical protein
VYSGISLTADARTIATTQNDFVASFPRDRKES